ncbi:uncharacterized protein F5891DRAFT_1183803 [Suillus fuscotomentosus]|uniref:Uncharacterized protein n=1 Tax=Suillus fuscotomentosus TaxID=1912939 RepID=A0AAD4HQI8_9AGAM|nr:uncharacterized protein F5891DRAFT_1183803 [Suillus fuscotomentosus]KAG1905097.1 hypothetical protein F5891DRAFT_1183803 [Suillus fuscotomentosus]
MSITSVVFSMYLQVLPDTAGIQSRPKKKSIEPKNRRSSASDEAKYPAAEVKTSHTPPSAKSNDPIVFPGPPSSTGSASNRPGGASLLDSFTGWAGQKNLKLSTSVRRVFRKVSQFLERKSESELTEIFGVGPAEYTTIEQFCEDFGLKPRLTYIHSQRTIFLEMPSGLHEAPMAAFQSAFYDFFRDIPYPKRGLINVNFLTNITQDASIPDLRISIQNVRDRQATLLIPCIGETAFSQHLSPLYTKLRTFVQENPGLSMIVVAIVQELHPYSSPAQDSTAYNVLLNGPKLNWTDFHLSTDEGNPTLGRPIVVGGHMWASLRSVHLKVWLRGAQNIDIDSVDPNLVADGSLFPADDDIHVVMAMIRLGAQAVRQSLVDLSQTMLPNMDVAPLQDPSIRFQLDGGDFVDKLVGGMTKTAYNRYQRWYVNAPRPKKPKRTSRARFHEDPDAPAANTRSQKRQR